MSVPEKPMTKTETRRLVAELRREAGKIPNVLTPTPEWIRQETGEVPLTEDQVRRIILHTLDNVDRLSAQLREGHR